MYHDQGHIALKALAFEEIVGWIIGTPVLVATVGHGSAFDIAGKGVADPTSLKAAIRQVARGGGGTQTTPLSANSANSRE